MRGRFREASSTEAGEVVWVVFIGDGEMVDGASAARAAAACGLRSGFKNLVSVDWLGSLALPLGVSSMVASLPGVRLYPPAPWIIE